MRREESKGKVHLKISIEWDIVEDEEQLIQFEIEYQKIKDRYWRTDEYIIRIQSVLRNSMMKPIHIFLEIVKLPRIS